MDLDPANIGDDEDRRAFAATGTAILAPSVIGPDPQLLFVGVVSEKKEDEGEDMAEGCKALPAIGPGGVLKLEEWATLWDRRVELVCNGLENCWFN